MICIICGTEFESYHNIQKCCSKECSKINNKEQQKRYNETHENKIKNYLKIYNENTKEKRKENARIYDRTPTRKEYRKKYRHTLKGAEASKRGRAKRKRNFKFNPLNVWFENSNAHHVNRNDVIYIPKELHENIHHSISRNYNMEKINTVAFFFLLMQNIHELKNLI